MCVGGKEKSEQLQFLEEVPGRVGRSVLNGSRPKWKEP